jgi:hypothetical protein
MPRRAIFTVEIIIIITRFIVQNKRLKSLPSRKCIGPQVSCLVKYFAVIGSGHNRRTVKQVPNFESRECAHANLEPKFSVLHDLTLTTDESPPCG